ncbi:hypothetical protein M0R45_017231 [Rubus argutus]|uniref:Uncharacterized protein n=1 Tax=Rubus argutus TaxID=59490 RepID=A0AAW1XYF7_RUBAR
MAILSRPELTLLVILCWCVDCHERNDIFHGALLPLFVTGLHDKIVWYWTYMLEVQDRLVQLQNSREQQWQAARAVRRQPPPFGAFKANCDGASCPWAGKLRRYLYLFETFKVSSWVLARAVAFAVGDMYLYLFMLLDLNLVAIVACTSMGCN